MKKVLILVFLFVLAFSLLPIYASAGANAGGDYTVYSQWQQKYWEVEKVEAWCNDFHHTDYCSLASSGCGWFALAHMVQWYHLDYCESDDSSNTNTLPIRLWNNANDSQRRTWSNMDPAISMVCSMYGIIDEGNNISGAESVRNTLYSGKVIIVNQYGHYYLAVEIEEDYVHIIDSCLAVPDSYDKNEAKVDTYKRVEYGSFVKMSTGAREGGVRYVNTWANHGAGTPWTMGGGSGYGSTQNAGGEYWVPLSEIVKADRLRVFSSKTQRQMPIVNLDENTPFVYAHIYRLGANGNEIKLEAKFGNDSEAIFPGLQYAIGIASDNGYPASQLWRFYRQDDGSYVIQDMTTGYILSADSNGTIGLFFWGNGITPEYTKWYIRDYGDHYEIESKAMAYRHMAIGSGSLSSASGVIAAVSSSVDANSKKLFVIPVGNIAPPRRLVGIEGFENIVLTMAGSGVISTGESQQIRVSLLTEINTEASTYRQVSWNSSNPDVAIVDSDGYVTGISEGTAVITAVSDFNPYLTGQFEITVESNCEHSWNNGIEIQAADCTRNGIMEYSCIYCKTLHRVTIPAKGHHYKQTPSGLICDICDNTLPGSIEWTETDSLPEYVTDELFDIEYQHTYTDTAVTCPGEGWIMTGSGQVHYENNGEPYNSGYALPTSETRVQIGSYYYHYCGSAGGYTINFLQDASHTDYHLVTETDKFSIISQWSDEDDAKYIACNLVWNNGSYATCAAGRTHYWYIGYRYQDRIAVSDNVWQLVTDWTSEYDPSAQSVHIRYRLKQMNCTHNYAFSGTVTPATADKDGIISEVKCASCSATLLNAQVIDRDSVARLPRSLKQLDTEALANIQAEQITIQDSCISIGSKSFAKCSNLKLVVIPDSVKTLAEDAFDECENLVFICSPNCSVLDILRSIGYVYIQSNPN